MQFLDYLDHPAAPNGHSALQTVLFATSIVVCTFIKFDQLPPLLKYSSQRNDSFQDPIPKDLMEVNPKMSRFKASQMRKVMSCLW